MGTYTYPTPGSPRPHAVTSVSGSTITTSFTYDANGNQTSGLGRTVTWSSYNKPASINQGAQTISFLDDPGHQRFQQVTPQGTTLYFDSFGVHAEFLTGSGQWNEYLTVGNQMVGVRFLTLSTESVVVRYFHTDHFGSISVITDQTGAVSERLSYDAWGKRRYPNGADDPADAITSQTTRGFTNQEELSIGGLVHLNGRVYDALMGRMMSADPTVPDALNPQSWNRYSYVGNDPLTFTDPTGFNWLSSFFHSVGNFFKSILSNSIVRAVVQIALAAIMFNPAVGLLSLVASAAASAAIVTGLAGGKLGAILKAGVIAGATAFAFFEVGSLAPVPGFNSPNFSLPNYVINIAGHAGVGCLSAVASGGKCGPGALSGAAGSAVAPLVEAEFKDPQDNLGDRLGGSAVSGIAGGLASVAGGGKFADGAVTAAFGYMFNAGAYHVTPESQAAGQQTFWNFMSGAAIVVGLLMPGAEGPAVLDGANFAQRFFNLMFSDGGLFSGRTVEDVAAALRSGELSAGDVPVQYITRDGNTLILNTRSSQALEQAGIPRASWNAVNMTGDAAAEARLTAQLNRNGLTSAGTPTVAPNSK